MDLNFKKTNIAECKTEEISSKVNDRFDPDPILVWSEITTVFNLRCVLNDTFNHFKNTTLGR